ncbi:MAG: DNA-processing protein DprA [Methylovirgula sp.]
MSAEAGLRLTDAQRFDWLRLWRSESIGPRTFCTLINRFGSARAALEALPRLASGGAVRIASKGEIERELALAEACGARFIALGEEDYPALLRKIDTAPPVVAVRGALSVFTRPAVAIVGSRNASGAGLAFTERLSRGLAQAGYVIVSGLARGIDIRAHQTAGETGTIAVLAGGHDKIYPAEHAAELERFLERGVAISEMPFGWEARGRDFPRRNRIIAGLAQGSVIVEAARRSGSLITARFAAEQGREVFAVPGSPLDPRAEGTNELIRDGATLCTSAQDVIEALARQIGDLPRSDLLSEPTPTTPGDEPLWEELDLPEVAAPPNGAAEPAQTDFAAPTAAKEVRGAATRARIISLLGPSPISVDELARVAKTPAREVRTILFELELDGRLERHGGDLVSLLG